MFRGGVPAARLAMRGLHILIRSEPRKSLIVASAYSITAAALRDYGNITDSPDAKDFAVAVDFFGGAEGFRIVV